MIALAMEDGYTSGGGMGIGLPGAKRLVNEFDSDVDAGRRHFGHDPPVEVVIGSIPAALGTSMLLVIDETTQVGAARRSAVALGTAAPSRR